MSRSLSQTLARLSPISSSRLMSLRCRSKSPEKISGVTGELEKVEDAIHRIIVKRSEPDWLPLVPGASYWVPPDCVTLGFAQVIEKLVDNSTTTSMMKGKSLCLSSDRGWPSSAHFFKGASSPCPLEGETICKLTTQSEDEEG